MKIRISSFLLCTMLLSFLLSGCGSESAKTEYAPRVTRYDYIIPTADGAESYSSGNCTIDASNSGEGYVMIKVASQMVTKVQIAGPDSIPYTYDIVGGDWSTFPLSAGSGSYKISILESVGDNFYSVIMGQMINAEIENEFSPFLYPNQYVWFTPQNEAVKLAQELSGKAENDLDFVSAVYHYVISNIKYDNEKAETITVLTAPDIDETLRTGAGICVDYASLMAAMLRSQGIPARLVFGYSGTQYHAWINVYIPEIGWIDRIIQFDGSAWSLMDPTLAASNSTAFVKQYTEDDSNYIVKYWY